MRLSNSLLAPWVLSPMILCACAIFVLITQCLDKFEHIFLVRSVDDTDTLKSAQCSAHTVELVIIIEKTIYSVFLLLLLMMRSPSVLCAALCRDGWWAVCWRLPFPLDWHRLIVLLALNEAMCQTTWTKALHHASERTRDRGRELPSNWMEWCSEWWVTNASSFGRKNGKRN